MVIVSTWMSLIRSASFSAIMPIIRDGRTAGCLSLMRALGASMSICNGSESSPPGVGLLILDSDLFALKIIISEFANSFMS